MPKSKKRRPARLYKYRRFSNLALDMLVEDKIYFADPSSFNDPLDAKPTLTSNVSIDILESILTQLFEQRFRAEFSAAAETIRYRGPRTFAHIDHLTGKRIQELLADIRYDASNPEYDDEEDSLKSLFAYSIQQELLLRYDKGIFSLAERSDCPLMWSHYADQHRGLCLGYSVPDDMAGDLHKVKYGGSRLIDASLVHEMLDGKSIARRKVDEAVLLRKADAWRYEKEWRLLGNRGAQDSYLELEEVIFGMRCAAPVKHAVVRALEKRDRAVDFYEIHEQSNSFDLEICPLETNDLTTYFPRRTRHLLEVFPAVKIPD